MNGVAEEVAVVTLLFIKVDGSVDLLSTRRYRYAWIESLLLSHDLE